jgi:hypothetical protein
LARHKNFGICGSLVGPPLLVPCCMKVISMHVITGK